MNGIPSKTPALGTGPTSELEILSWIITDSERAQRNTAELPRTFIEALQRSVVLLHKGTGRFSPLAWQKNPPGAVPTAPFAPFSAFLIVLTYKHEAVYVDVF